MAKRRDVKKRREKPRPLTAEKQFFLWAERGLPRLEAGALLPDKSMRVTKLLGLSAEGMRKAQLNVRITTDMQGRIKALAIQREATEMEILFGAAAIGAEEEEPS
jgi:hypothetical protein